MGHGSAANDVAAPAAAPTAVPDVAADLAAFSADVDALAPTLVFWDLISQTKQYHVGQIYRFKPVQRQFFSSKTYIYPFIVTRRLTSSSCRGLRLRPFMLFLLVLGNFWCSVITSITFSSTLSKFEKIKKIQKNVKEIHKSITN